VKPQKLHGLAFQVDRPAVATQLERGRVQLTFTEAIENGRGSHGRFRKTSDSLQARSMASMPVCPEDIAQGRSTGGYGPNTELGRET